MNFMTLSDGKLWTDSFQVGQRYRQTDEGPNKGRVFRVIKIHHNSVDVEWEDDGKLPGLR